MLKIAFCPLYAHSLPPGHRFPMSKYELIPEQLLYEGTCTADNFFCPDTLDEKLILNVHTVEYWENLKSKTISPKMIRRIGFPLSDALIRRETIIASGTIACCDHAMQHGVSMNVAGGTHHAFPDKGEGFCLLNDVGIAASHLLTSHLAQKILVIDLDVHQGNGTAVMFQNEPRVFTFSMHGKDNYPLHKELSDLDIALATGIKDTEYLAILQENLSRLFEELKPDFAFYIAGVDILETDKLGHLSVSRQGCHTRDEIVFRYCQNAGIPLVVSMGGGYSHKISDIIEAHCNTFRLAQKMYF